jgi:hypothetical protein
VAELFNRRTFLTGGHERPRVHLASVEGDGEAGQHGCGRRRGAGQPTGARVMELGVLPDKLRSRLGPVARSYLPPQGDAAELALVEAAAGRFAIKRARGAVSRAGSGGRSSG